VVAAVVAATGVMAAAVMAFGLGSGGCFSPKFESCAVSCGEGSACPDDQICLSDGKCHASQDEVLCTPGGGDASVDDGDDISDDVDDTYDDVDDTSDDVDDVSDDTSDDDADDLPPPDGGTPDAASPDAGVPVTPTSPGDLVISEIHKDPVEAGDLLGEWFEVLNPTGQTFNLQGLQIRDDDKDSFLVDSAVIVPPGGRVVFARSGNDNQNGGVTGVDFAYGDFFVLGNGEDEVVLQNLDNGATLDRVAYGFDFPLGEGAALSLDPESENSIDNDDAKNWCEGSTVFGDGDLGSPGSANPDC
jgi:hypothetical protein